MAYTINLTNGSTLTTLADGTVNSTSCALTLIGKNYAGYGTFYNDNIVHLMENFSDDTPPTTPLTGQLWWDTAGNLNVYTGSQFVNLAAITSSTSQPSGPRTGNQWWDTTNNQFNVYNGASWTLIGPAFTSGQGTSGIEVSTILDTNAVPHTAVSLYSGNVRIAILSNAAAYTPASAISGFSLNPIRPGFNLTGNVGSSVAGARYWGTADNTDQLGGLYANAFALLSGATFTGDVATQTAVKIGSGGSANAFVSQLSGTVAQIINTGLNADLVLRANVGGTLANVIQVIGSTGQINVPNVMAVSGNLSTSSYLLVTQGDNSTSTTTGALRVTGGIGATGNVTCANVTVSGNVNATNFVGDAISALYGDLAERFTADQAYIPGTVLQLGGSAEVTLEDQDLSEQVFGVVSTQPGYIMNARAGSDPLHPAIAVSGRVPVRVLGRVGKGDRLVSAGGGLARAGSKSELTAWNVIGRSLEDKLDLGEGSVLAIVKLNS